MLGRCYHQPTYDDEFAVSTNGDKSAIRRMQQRGGVAVGVSSENEEDPARHLHFGSAHIFAGESNGSTIFEC